MDATVRKQTIRRLTLARRARLSVDDRSAAATALVARTLALDEIVTSRSILAFVSISTEVPTEDLLKAILDSGRTLLLPYVADDGAMRASVVGSLSELEPGYRGIPEPRSRVPVAADSADAIIIPGVAFDEHGGRLGYGGGFYDRFLAAAHGVSRIGICFETQMVEEIPMLEHDRSVNIVVTDQRTIRCR